MSEDQQQWEIDSTAFTADDILQNGNIMFSGNGYMGMRGTTDEAGHDDMASIIVNGMYDRQGNKWREPVNIPNPLCVRVSVPGDTTCLSLSSNMLVTHEQHINFRYGVFGRKTVWQVNGTNVTITSRRFLSMIIQHVLCLEFSVTADADITLSVTPIVDTDVYGCNGPHFQSGKKENDDSGMLAAYDFTTLEKKTPFTVAQYVSVSSKKEAKRNEQIMLKKNKPFTMHVYGAVYCGIDYSGRTAFDSGRIHEDAVRCLTSLANEEFETLLAAQRKAWDKIWEDGDVIIEGDEVDQKELRFNLYQLQCIAPRGNKELSIPARGLSGQTYKGAVFWDTELFMQPYFLYTNPSLAKNFIRYRIKTLGGALRKAKSYGYEGAFYAWESQENGDDACSDYNVTDVFTKRPMRTYFRDKQIHISAAVVYAMREYVEVTGDYSVLLEGGLEVIMECALFYLSRCVYVPLKDRYEVHDVIGPDEYHERVDNNAYTNRMIRYTFDTAVKYLNELESDNNTFFQEIVSKNNFTEYIPRLSEVSAKLYSPSVDHADTEEKKAGVIEQFDGYFMLEDCPITEVKKRLLNPKEYWGGANGVASQTQIIKQADVVLMINLFDDDFTKQMKKANYTYYEPRTEHGSSLSSCMYGLLACKIDRTADAYRFFKKTAEVDLQGKSKQFAGLIYIGGTHPAASGGAWMMAVMGFCGMTCKKGIIHLQPRLPETWNKVTFTVQVQKKKYTVTVDKKGYTQCLK